MDEIIIKKTSKYTPAHQKASKKYYELNKDEKIKKALERYVRISSDEEFKKKKCEYMKARYKKIKEEKNKLNLNNVD